MKTTAAVLVLSVLTVVTSACGGDEDLSIDETVLSGTVGGQAWTFMSGETDAFLSEGEDSFFSSFYATDEEPCGFGFPDGDQILASVPKTPGEYDFSSSLNLTFAVGGDNLITYDGVIRVDEVTETTVSGGLAASYDGDNTVSGNFELTICVDDQI